MKPPTYAAITAYARTIGWDLHPEQVTAFLARFRDRSRNPWETLAYWRHDLRDFCERCAPYSGKAPGLARAVDLALNCPT